MANAHVLISSQTLGSAAASVTFGSGGTLPQGYRDLILVVTGTSVSNQNMNVYYNGDNTNTNYPAVYAGGDGTTASSGTLNNYYGGIYGANLTTNTITIFDYAQTDKHKTSITRLAAPSGASSMIATRWANTAAITSIVLSINAVNFNAGCSFVLYGVLG